MKLADIPAAPSGGFTLPGTLGSSPGVNAAGKLSDVISVAIGVITVIAFIWFVIQFFLAAVQIISSGGDKNALSAAKSKLSTSVIGVVVVVSAIFLIEVVGTVLGIDILNLPALVAGLMP